MNTPATPRSPAADMLYGIGGKLLYAATRVALPPLALAHMGLADYGLWAACFVLVGYIGMAASGFALVTLRQTARLHASGDIAAIGRLLSTGMGAMGGLALLLLGGLWLALPALLDGFKVAPAQRVLATELWLGVVAVFLADMSLGAFAQVLHAVGRVRQEQTVWMAAFVGESLLIVALLAAGWGVHGLLAAFAGRYLFSASANAWLACRALPGLRLSWRGFDAGLLRGFFGWGAGMQVSGLIATALFSADRLLAGLLIGPQATALVDLAVKLPGTAGSIGASASAVAVSAAARHDARGQAQAGRAVYADASRVTVACLALVMPLLAAFAPLISLAWLGAGATQAAVAPLMAWLALGLQAHLLTGPATAVSRGRGRLNADFAYHGLRAGALAAALAAWWLLVPAAPGQAALPLLMAALALGQVAAGLGFVAWAHHRLSGGWAGLGRPLLWPTLASHAAAQALALAWAVLGPAAASSRAGALGQLAGLLLLWLPLAGALLAPCLTTPAERQALARRCWPRATWRTV